jgi:hypothetical protein
MRRVQVALVAVGTLVFSVFIVSNGTVGEQTAFLDDAGLAPNRNCTCPVRLDTDFAADAGLRTYQRLTFPCVLTVLPDAGRDVQMPPMPVQAARDAIQVVDWNDCTLAASTAPVSSKWGTARPFVGVAAAAKPWCRAKFDAGLPCALLDGGTFGDRNVGLCALRADPATCERVGTGVIYLGDSDEDIE